MTKLIMGSSFGYYLRMIDGFRITIPLVVLEPGLLSYRQTI